MKLSKDRPGVQRCEQGDVLIVSIVGLNKKVLSSSDEKMSFEGSPRGKTRPFFGIRNVTRSYGTH